MRVSSTSSRLQIDVATRKNRLTSLLHQCLEVNAITLLPHFRTERLAGKDRLREAHLDSLETVDIVVSVLLEDVADGEAERAKTVEKSVPVTRLPINTISSPERLIVPGVSGPVSSYASRASLARRRTALRIAVRARWDQLKLWKASGRLSEMQRRVRDALPGRERVYQYVGLERHPYSVSLLPSEQGLVCVGEDASYSPVS